MPNQHAQTEEPDYAALQAARNREYLDAWAAWWNELSPAERESLRACGITGAHLDAHGAGAPELDLSRLADTPALATNPAETLDTSDPRVVEAACEMARVLVGELVSASNKALTVECLAFVTGIAYDGASQTEIAARHGVTRAAVSKRCVELADKLGLPPSRAMKSNDTRMELSRAQTAAHKRRMARAMD